MLGVDTDEDGKGVYSAVGDVDVAGDGDELRLAAPSSGDAVRSAVADAVKSSLRNCHK